VATQAAPTVHRWGHWAAILVLIGAIAATFGNAVDNDFVFDDQNLIVDAPAVRMPLAAGFAGLNYRPLRTLSYRLDYAIGGMSPRVFHVSNLCYHALTAVLVYAVLLAIGIAPTGAAAGALLFAIHPVQADAVTYLSGRRDVLCGLFYAAGVLAYLRWRRSGGAWLLAAGLCYALAILAKEMAITMPAACFLIDRWRRVGSEEPGRREAAVSGRLLAIGGLGVAVLYMTYGHRVLRMANDRRWHGGSVVTNAATMARVWVKYLQLVVWPARLSADYSFEAFPVSTSLLDPRALAALAVLAVVAVAAVRSWRRRGLFGLGMVWMAVTLLPVSHLIPFRELLAEHYLYIPMMGVAMMAAGAVDAAVVRWPERRALVAAAAAIVLVVAAGRTALRNLDWRDRITLWTATVALEPRCARAQYNLGQAYFERSRLADAERAWLAAAEVQPDDLDTASALAKLYYRLGNYELASARIEAVLARPPVDPDALTLAGWVALDSGKPMRALDYFNQALAVLPPDKAAGARTGHDRAMQVMAGTPGQIVETIQGGGRTPFKR